MDKKEGRGTETFALLSIICYNSLCYASSQEEKILSIQLRRSALIFSPSQSLCPSFSIAVQPVFWFLLLELLSYFYCLFCLKKINLVPGTLKTCDYLLCLLNQPLTHLLLLLLLLLVFIQLTSFLAAAPAEQKSLRNRESGPSKRDQEPDGVNNSPALKGAGLTSPVLSNDNCDSMHFKSHAQMLPSEALWVIVAF